MKHGAKFTFPLALEKSKSCQAEFLDTQVHPSVALRGRYADNNVGPPAKRTAQPGVTPTAFLRQSPTDILRNTCIVHAPARMEGTRMAIAGGCGVLLLSRVTSLARASSSRHSHATECQYDLPFAVLEYISVEHKDV
jgi:hypothetical protein